MIRNFVLKKKKNFFFKYVSIKYKGKGTKLFPFSENPLNILNINFVKINKQIKENAKEIEENKEKKEKKEREEKKEHNKFCICNKRNFSTTSTNKQCDKYVEEKKNNFLKKKIIDLTNKKDDFLYKENKKKTIFFESERIVKCLSGNGGEGNISFKKYKRKVFGNMGIPNGGRGGNGGSVFLCFIDNEENKNKIHKRKRNNKNNKNNKHIFIQNLRELPCVLNASNGEKGKANQVRGKDGSNIYVYLNKPCFVYELFSDSIEKKKENEQINENNNIQWNKDTTTNTLINYSGNYEQVYATLKKNDPVYAKRNNHILKELIQYEKKIKKEIFKGFLNKNNNCIILSKGGLGGKGNNMNNVFTNEKGEKGNTHFIRIVYKCICDVCFVGCEDAGKSTLLSLITHKIYTVNNLYMLKKIYYKDNFQISVADFFNLEKDFPKDNTNKNNKENNNGTPTFYVNPNLLKYMQMIYLFVIVLDFQRDIMKQFHSIKNELKQKDELIFQKPFFVVINKCDITFSENIKKAEDAYNDIKKENADISIFFISAKYALGIENFVTCLREQIEKIKKMC